MISTHTYSAHLIGTPDVAIDLKGGTITLDAGRAPHVQASITIGPVAEEVYEALDPRLGPRVRIDVTAVFGGSTQARSFDLGVRARPIRYLDGDYGLSLASDEAILLELAELANNLDMLAFTSGRDVVDFVLTATLGVTLAPGDDFTIPGDADPEALVWRAGDSALEFLQPILETGGYRLVCDEARVWTLRGEGHTVPGTVLIRHLTNMIDANETIDRDRGMWFDAAVTRWKWTDVSGIAHEYVEAWSLTDPDPPTLVKTFDKSTAYKGAGFSEYAVRRAQGRGREVSATCVADWRAKPEQVLEFTLPGTPVQTGLAQAVSFDLDSDEMTVTTRTVDTPLSAWVLIPEGESWLDSPISDDWISEVI